MAINWHGQIVLVALIAVVIAWMYVELRVSPLKLLRISLGLTAMLLAVLGTGIFYELVFAIRQHHEDVQEVANRRSSAPRSKGMSSGAQVDRDDSDALDKLGDYPSFDSRSVGNDARISSGNHNSLMDDM